MADARQLQAEIEALQQQIAEREAEATQRTRELEMAQHAAPKSRQQQRAKGQGGDIQASTQEGRVQEVEEEIAMLRQRLVNLQSQAGN